MAGQRRRQVIAQAEPLLVVVLQAEHARVGPVGVGQELAQRLGVFEQRGFDGVETIALVDRLDLADHLVDSRDVRGQTVLKAPREPRFDALRLL
jgi:hypothetical protein